MKKISVLFLSILLFCSSSMAEEPSSVVLQMTYIVKMPDVIREGLYTGSVNNGIPDGFGVFVTKNSSGVEWHYIGEWKDGVMSGKGGQYWENGQCIVGEFENNDMTKGYEHYSPSTNRYTEYTPNEHGCYNCKLYRTDESIYFDGCINPETWKIHEGTIYTKEGDVFFSGEIGEGFNWNLIYIE